MMPAALRIVYVAGAARSGSTLLGQLLGAQPGVLDAGELSLFWRDYARGNRCSCGRRLPDCPLWGRCVGDLGLTGGDVARLAATRARLARTTRPLGLVRMRRRGPSGWSGDQADLVRATGELLTTAADRTGAETIVDTSKTLPAARFYLLLPGVRLGIVHLVRDPRAVAASVRRSRDVVRGNPESLPPGGTVPMAVTRWWWSNTTALLTRRTADHHTTVRYEHLTADPAAVLTRLGADLDLRVDPGTLDGATLTSTDPGHVAVGNPSRMARVVTISPDDRWRSDLSARQRRLIRLTTAPMDLVLGRDRHPA